MALQRCTRHGYTLKSACPVCDAASVKAGPARYSPEDPYGAYRRRLKSLAATESTAADASQGGRA